MIDKDWMQIDEFKDKVITVRKSGAEFISISDAYQHICNDWIRYKNYAVLTFDDGYASLKEILPWLEEQRIPITLFINGKHLDGKSYRENPKERYLTWKDLICLTSSLVEIGSHGWEHKDAAKMNAQEFEESLRKNIELLSKHPRYVPFHAYTWGNHVEENNIQLQQYNIIPVMINGGENYDDISVINRELLR